MQFQFDLTSSTPPRPAPPQLPPAEMVPYLLNQLLDQQRDLLSQLVDVQQQHLNHIRAISQEQIVRWRHVLARTQQQHPAFADSCKRAFPVLEKAYVQMLVNLIEEIADQGEEALETEFEMQEFVDKYGVKVSQLTHVLSVLGPMAEAANQNELARQQQEAVKQQNQPQQTPPA